MQKLMHLNSAGLSWNNLFQISQISSERKKEGKIILKCDLLKHNVKKWKIQLTDSSRESACLVRSQ